MQLAAGVLSSSRVLEAPLMIENRDAGDPTNDAADLYWLAFLLTGRRDISIDIAADAALSHDDAGPFFADWMRSWSRRIVIAKALDAVRAELAESARRTEQARFRKWAGPSRQWSLSPDTPKARIEEALLAIDVFPRAALLLLVFEGVRLADAAALLGVDAKLVRKGQAIGSRELTANLARKWDHAAPGFSPLLLLASAIN